MDSRGVWRHRTCAEFPWLDTRGFSSVVRVVRHSVRRAFACAMACPNLYSPMRAGLDQSQYPQIGTVCADGLIRGMPAPGSALSSPRRRSNRERAVMTREQASIANDPRATHAHRQAVTTPSHAITGCPHHPPNKSGYVAGAACSLHGRAVLLQRANNNVAVHYGDVARE